VLGTWKEPVTAPLEIPQLTEVAVTAAATVIVQVVSSGLNPVPVTETKDGGPLEGTTTDGDSVAVGPPAGENTLAAESPWIPTTVIV
jgi:hypothetical protein